MFRFTSGLYYNFRLMNKQWFEGQMEYKDWPFGSAYSKKQVLLHLAYLSQNSKSSQLYPANKVLSNALRNDFSKRILFLNLKKDPVNLNTMKIKLNMEKIMFNLRSDCKNQFANSEILRYPQKSNYPKIANEKISSGTFRSQFNVISDSNWEQKN